MKAVESRRLKTLLFDADLTYAKAAKQIGISENNFQQKINGNRRWWLEECISIARILGYEDLKDVFPERYERFLRKS